MGQFGYRVYNFTTTFEQFTANIPFSIYILSPAIASFFVLKKNKRITGLIEWLKNVFYAKNSFYPYLLVAFGSALYFGIHIAVSRRALFEFPLYVFFISLPGNLIIGGLEESGWMYILQPTLHNWTGTVVSNAAIIVVSIVTVQIYDKRRSRTS